MTTGERSFHVLVISVLRGVSPKKEWSMLSSERPHKTKESELVQATYTIITCVIIQGAQQKTVTGTLNGA